MKIAMFGHKSIPSRTGGVEIVVEELSARMAALGHEVTCYNRRPAASQKSYRGIRLKTVPTIRMKGLAAVSSSFFAAVHAAFSRADVCHIHAEGPAFMSFLPKICGKRVVVTIHGLDWQREKWNSGFAACYIRWGEKMAVRFAHEIIVLNRDLQQYFLQTYGRETRLIPNGVVKPIPMPPKQIRDRFSLGSGDYLLYLGRLVPEKGIHELIEAFAGVRTQKKLVIAGASSDTDAYVQSLKAMAAADRRILLVGFAEGQLLAEFFSNAYLYVLPSHLEGMPLSLLEAMSYGNCCLVSDIPACRDVVEDRGITFPTGNVQVLRETLQRLCDEETFVQSYGSGAAEFVCGKYDWDQITRETLELYHENTVGP